jgi:hypothetical protein
MSGYYGRDKIKITPVTKNTTTGETTLGKAFEVSAYVEDLDSTRKVTSGRDPDSELFIIVWEDVDIRKGYHLELVEQFGVAVVGDIKKRIVQQSSRMGGITQNSLELFA